VLNWCSLRGVFDLRPALEAVEGGYVLTAKQLEGLADTLEAIFRAKEVSTQKVPGKDAAGQGSISSNSSGALVFPELALLAVGIDDEDRSILRAIRDCIQVGGREHPDGLEGYRFLRVISLSHSKFLPLAHA
jgi:DNA mismatch repair protein MutS2